MSYPTSCKHYSYVRSQSPKSGSGSGSGKAAPAPEKKPAHEHSWQPVTEKRWVENWVTVTDQAAWDEEIPGAKYLVCNGCGKTFSTSGAASAHSEDMLVNYGEGGHSSTTAYEPSTYKHHDAVTHQEDQGYYETVTTGHKCSCGAAK